MMRPHYILTAVLLLTQLSYADSRDEARMLLEQSGVKGGFVVQLGVGDGQRLAALKANDSYQVQGIDRDATAIARARETLLKQKIYGPVAADRFDGVELPYIDNLVNLLVAEDLGSIKMDEVQRVLVPGGVAMIKDASGKWNKTIKTRTDKIDEWSHYLHDASGNAVAHDREVGPPRHLQWVGSPRYSRHHDRMASMSALVSTNGRMFYIMDEGSRISIQLPPKWKLIARDAFNGTVLWKKDIATWQSHLWPLKSGPTQLSRRLVSTDEIVYATLGYDAPLSALDAATGKSLREYAGSDGTEEIIHTNGMLFLVVRKGKAELADYTPVNPTVGDQALARDFFWNEEARVVMAFDANSGKQLWAKQTKISPLTLAADKNNLFFHDGEKLICLKQTTGDSVWQTEPVTRRNQFNFNFGPRLVIHEDVVLYAGGDGKMLSVNAADGKQLWTAEHPNSGYQSPQDLMVVQGLVWCAPLTAGKDSGVFTGRDLHTGEIKKQFPPNIDTYWFHHRCYIAKATDNFIIPSRTGVEFVDPKAENWDIHHWVRGGCLYGVMPCNGLTYTPPHDCACYPEAKLFGFNALAPMAPTRPIPAEVPEEGRLEKGPAFDRALAVADATNDEDWPTYRHDASRSGTATKAIPAELTQQWKIPLGGRLTAPSIAGGIVYVAQVDEHTLYALDAKDGQQRWKFTAGARIDSPPTIHRGRVLFGATDGWVYCLDSKDGQLAWRYRAAPLDRRTMAFEQLESLWPVHGSVLVRDDIAYCVAGRSNFLDGGLRLLRLQVSDGKKLTENIMDETNPDTGNNMQEKLQILQMPVGLPDILSADDKFLYMKSQKFDFEGKRLKIGPNSGDFVKQASVQRGEGEHIFAPMGFLDDTWFHRSYWVLGQSFAGGHGGYYQAGRFAPSGQLMVKGNGYVFGYGRKPQYLRWTTTMEHQLFAADPSPPEIPEDFGKAAGGAANASCAQFPKSPNLDATGRPLTIEAWMTSTNPNGVIIANGGPAEGFALTLEAGLPTFHMRSASQLSTVAGKKRIIGGWHHVVGVLRDTLEMELYVDGELAGSGKASGFLTKDPAQGLEIAADLGSAVGEYQSPYGFTGVIDEVRIYFEAVSADAIKKRYENELEMAPDPKLVVTFDDGSARDLSLYRNNGTIEGGVPIEGHTGKAVRFSNNAARLNVSDDDVPTKNNKAGGKAKQNGNNKAGNQPANQAGNKGNNANKAQAGNSLIKPKWTSDIPVYARAMVLAGDELFVAGPLDMIDEEETFKKLSEKDAEVQQLLTAQDDALNGGVGGLLLSINCGTGEVDKRIELGTLPSWDGMAGAGGKLFLSTVDGQVMCYGAKQ